MVLESSVNVFRKLARLAGRAPKRLLEEAITLYFVMIDEDTPSWARIAIAAALAYVVCPFDAIPDFIPFTGFADDLVVVTGLIARLSGLVHPHHRESARRALK